MTHVDSYDLTLYSSLYSVDKPTPLRLTWEEITQQFSKHICVTKKDAAPGFGPYLIHPPDPSPCYDHRDGLPRSQPHRCDNCVRSLSLAVFDVDQGNIYAVEQTRDELLKKQISHVFYTSFSYYKNKGAWRLIIPLKAPVSTATWPIIRLGIIKQFKIPADPSKCSGASHFYYLPSCPDYGRPPQVHIYTNTPLDPSTVPVDQVQIRTAHRRASMKASVASSASGQWQEPETPYEVLSTELDKHRTFLASKAERLLRNVDPQIKQKGVWLQRAVAGEPLDVHGSRTVALLVTSGVMVAALPARTPRAVFEALLEDSLEGMMNEGSSLDESRLEGMLLPAMRRRDLREQEDDAISEVIKNRATRQKAAVPVKGTFTKGALIKETFIKGTKNL